MSRFTVRHYEPGDEEGILALFNEVFAEGNPGFVPRSMETWRHIYLENPAGRQVVVAEDADKNIIANYSAISGYVSVRGTRRPCSQPVDTCVAKAWRGSLRRNSVFVTTAAFFVQEFCTTGAPFYNEIMYGLPNEQAFGVGTRIVGYKPVHCPMPVQVREFGPEWIDELVAASGAVEVSESDGRDLSGPAALFEDTLHEVPLGLWRDEAYLAWRYRDAPDAPYRLLEARREGRLVGALVFRLGWMGQPIVPLVDWLGPGADREALAALLAAVARITRDAGGRRLETWVTPNMAQHATLRSLGFAEESTRFNLCIMVFSTTFDLDWAKANWFFTMGDSDIF